MPPFRYLGNIRGRIGARFGLEAGHGKAKITLATTEAGLVPEDGSCSFFLETARFARFGIDRFVPLWPDASPCACIGRRNVRLACGPNTKSAIVSGLQFRKGPLWPKTLHRETRSVAKPHSLFPALVRRWAFRAFGCSRIAYPNTAARRS